MNAGGRGAWIVLLLALACPVRAWGQAADQLLRQGVAAYYDLNYGESVRLLEAALTAQGGQALDPAGQVEALSYLGASHVFRDRRPEADAAFRALLLVDPRGAPDRTIFPPLVLRVFEDVREATKAVGVQVPVEARLIIPRDSLRVRVYATSTHDIDARITSERGDTVLLYRGPVRDSLVLPWHGRGADGQPVASGALRLIVTSLGPGDATLRSIGVPLSVERGPADTLPHPAPPDTELLPERGSAATALGTAVPAAVGAVAAIVLPSIVADGEGLAGRFAIGVALSGVGIGVLLADPPGRVLPENRAANEATRDAWRRAVDAAIKQNTSRRGATVLVIRAGRPVRVEGGQ